MITSWLISSFKDQLDKEGSNASHDALTHLLNRPSIEQLIEKEIDRVRRYKTYFSLVYLDLDKFKEINDQFGHQCGDIVIQKYAEILQKNLRITDSVARIGGDEFILLLPETNKNSAELLLKKIEDHIKTNQNKKEPLMPGFSAGIVVCEEGTSQVHELINKTDKHMYYAKQQKKSKAISSHDINIKK
jgi:diguanylate cyclase (GGDEF)-like protein